MIYVILRSSGEYDEYRQYPILYSEYEEDCVEFCEKAKEEAQRLEEKRAELNTKYLDKHIDEIKVSDYEDYDKECEKLKSKFDEELKPDDFDTAEYTYYSLEKLER